MKTMLKNKESFQLLGKNYKEHILSEAVSLRNLTHNESISLNKRFVSYNPNHKIFIQTRVTLA